MAQDYILLDGKKYKIVAEGYEPVINRQRVYKVGLTGLTLIQDFTVADRMPRFWNYRLRVFTANPWPDDGTWAVMDDLKAAYVKPYFEFVEFDQVTTHQVGIAHEIKELLRVPANWQGDCNGITFVDVQLLKVQQVNP